jgi:hypothetical protein
LHQREAADGFCRLGEAEEEMRETTGSVSEAVSPGAPPQHRPADLAARALDDVKDLGTGLLGAARDSAVALLDEQRYRAAKEVAALANVLHSSVAALDEAGGPTVARYAEEAARRVDGAAGKLRDSSWSELSAELEAFARRWPLAFLAAALGAGVVAGRILFAAPPRPTAPPADGPLGAATVLPASADGAARPETAGAPSAGAGARGARRARAAR